MKTVIKLLANGRYHQFEPDCLKNWDDVMCTYKRSELSGVIRSFTSKFEFFGEAYDLLLSVYLAGGYTANAKVSVWTMGNDWTYSKQFECPLDFSTVQIENGIFTISAVDDSVAALIKANKSTKYELAVGSSDIETDGFFQFDRIPMSESVTYAFTQGDSEDSGSLIVSLEKADGNVIWLGSIADEISIGKTVAWNDDQENEEDGYILEAVKNVSINLEASVAIDSCYGGGVEQTVKIQRTDKYGNVLEEADLCRIGYRKYTDVGTFASAADLRAAYPEHDGTPLTGENWIATIDGILWHYTYNGNDAIWESTGQSKEGNPMLTLTYTLNKTFDMEPEDRLRAIVPWGEGEQAVSRVISSSIKFSWLATGDVCTISAFKPATVLEAVMRKICKDKANITPRISSHDERIGNTVLMAAESIRGIKNARFYTSFNDFCEWMEAVFGYTYYLGALNSTPLVSQTQEFGGMTESHAQSSSAPPSVIYSANIKYCEALGRFILIQSGCYYSWPGSDKYNNPETGSPWTDRLYTTSFASYYFTTRADGTVNPVPVEFHGSESDRYLPFQEVCFVHRSELFDADADTKVIDSPKEVRQSTDAGNIYSSVQVGYDKKDYDSVNGRDEFNFNNTYTTGFSVSTKKLPLMSGYRADCYGIEFAAQKREKSTTDSDSDNDVFFAHVITDGNTYTPDRTIAIEGALNDSVFNAAFSPMACVRANAGYIAMQGEGLKLSFASSKGNSDIKIDGESMSADLTLEERFLTCDNVEFTCDDLTLPDMADLVCIEKNGLRYRGFISEVEECFAREEPVKYKLLVKSIEQC